MLNSRSFILKRTLEGAEKYGYVPSKSESGVNHLVYKKNGKWNCDCVAGLMQKECRHIKIMAKQNGEGERCFYCGKTSWCGGLDKHHVERRSLRPDLIDSDDNKMFLCRRCHDRATTEVGFEENLQNIWKLRNKQNETTTRSDN